MATEYQRVVPSPFRLELSRAFFFCRDAFLITRERKRERERDLEERTGLNLRHLLDTRQHTGSGYWLTIYPQHLMGERHYLLIFNAIGRWRSKTTAGIGEG